MTNYDIVRLKAAQALGLKGPADTSFTTADFQALSASQAQALDDLTSLYMVENPSQFTAGQVSVAQNIVSGPGFAARFAANYQSSATGFLQVTKNAIAGVADFSESAAKAAVGGAASYLNTLKWIALAGAGLWIFLEFRKTARRNEHG